MRWTGLFMYLSVVAVLTLYFHSLAGWAWWVTLLLILLLVPPALVIGFMTRHEVRWSTVLSYLSVAALLGAVAAQVAGSTTARDWCLLVWSVLLLAVTTWADLPELRRVAGLLAAASYSIWVAGLGWVFWAMERAVRTAGSASHAVGSTANA